MRLPFRAMRRTLCFWNHIIANNNAHSFACVLLFPKSTKYLLGSPDLRYRNITLRQILILRLVRQKPRLKWWFLSNCQKDTLAIIYNNRCVLININTSVYDMEIKSGRLWYIEKNWLKFTNELYWYFNWFSFNSLFWANKMVQWQGTLYGMDNKTT